MKILSPVGNFESLKMAVFNGADEVYLGINDFNARNNIDGFGLADLQEAVQFAHTFDVKVNLAINILFSDEEMQKALDIVVDAYNMGVDSFIVQDIGLANLIFKHYPQIEVHASTQMGLHNLEGVKFAEKMGFKRVVLARETPLQEIENIRKNTSVEIEYFAQGALCVCFSGNCYLSAYMCDASGNRGKCKQLCRLPYTFEKNGKMLKKGFLLSAKDFNMIDRLADLKAAGVDVLKIEGRARRSAYVAMTTRQYFNALHNRNIDKKQLKLAFNREFTAGYFDGNGKIISYYQNHIGIKIGRVEKVSYGKRFNEIVISSSEPLSPKSTFKVFANGKEKTTLSAFDLKQLAKGKYVFTTTQKLAVGDEVSLIVDAKLEESLLGETKKAKVNIKLFAENGKPIVARVEVLGKFVEVEGQVCQPAQKQPLTEKEIADNFKKHELFEGKVEVCKLDNVFMPKQQLNEFRRNVFDKVFEVVTNAFRHDLKKIEVKTNYKAKSLEDFEIVENQDQKFVAQNVIYSPSVYDLADIQKFVDKCNKHNKKAWLDLPNFALDKDVQMLKEIVAKTNVAVVANNHYALDFDCEKVIGWGLNVFNSHAAGFYDLSILAAEGNVGCKVSAPYMTLRHCPFKSHLQANCANCPYADGYTYRMDNGKVLSLKRKKMSTCTFYLTD
ncbi:MAG: U32 family peptidase [Clostridia bacterium]|nr:U32 family peptidase [Clostridia bacterium]